MTQLKTPPLQGFNPDNIPDSLKANARWAPWKAVWSEKRQKYDKIPHLCTAPHYGISTAKPERWGTFDQALKAYGDNPSVFAGLGYVMTTPHGVIAIDLDNCVKDNTIADWAQGIVDQACSYTELSPSGKGLRIMALGEIPNDWTNNEVGIEVYAGHQPRFLTITGQRLKASVQGLSQPDVFPELSARYAKSKTTATVISMQLPDILDEMVLPSLDSLPLSASTVKFLTTGETNGDRSLALFAAAIGLYNSGLTDEEVFSMLALNPFTMEVALDHRRQDSDRALMYLWVESCQKGKAKSTPVAGLADFEMLAPAAVVETVAPREFVELIGDADDFDDVSGEGEESRLNTPLAPAIIAQAATNSVATPKHRFEVISADQFAGGAPPRWIVKGVLPEAELVVLFGESGSGKSFVALDIAGAIARGAEWRGRKVKQGRVVYVAAEGAGGFRNRLNAYAKGHELDLATLNLGVIKAAPNMMIRDDALDVCKAIIAGGPVSVVIIDTFAQVMPGANENAGEDVGKALQHCKGIHKATGAVVILVHHAGKDSSKGARGWSGLRAAADAELEVVRTPTGRLMRSTKQKDGEDGLEWGFDLSVLPIGVDEDGEVLTSCVVQEAAIPVPLKGGAGANKNTGKWPARVLEVLGELTLVQTVGIEKKAVIDEVLRRSPEGVGESNRRAASRALTNLLNDDEGEYVLEDGCIALLA